MSGNEKQRASVLARQTLMDLRHLADKAFPKVCRKCGKNYPDLNAFLRNTSPLEGSGGLSSEAGADMDVFDLYRNCACGTTLGVIFHERRDTSEVGNKVRSAFGTALDALVFEGMEREHARQELLKIVRGGDSPEVREILEKNEQ